MTVDIISSVLNGDRFLQEFLDSLAIQTHEDWRLWVRDDGSEDGTVAILRAAAAADPRVRVLHIGGPRLGVAGAYGWVLERIPPDAAYIMCGDADDVWLPHKIERTLAAMLDAERAAAQGTAILVHTDLVVVDDQLRVQAPSFWQFSGIDPEPPSLRRLVVRNVTTAPAVMLNRSLRELVGRTPPEALFQDWWYALVAAALGKIVAVREPTILYRQHGANAVGARRDPIAGVRSLPRLAVRGLRGAREFRNGIRQTAGQARALLDAYGDRMTEADVQFLRAYAAMPQRGFFRRKLDLLRLRALPEQGTWRALGALIRG